MDPFTFAVIALVASYVFAAPDHKTATARAGTAGAVRSAGRAAAGSIRSDWNQASAARANRIAAKRQARLDRWAGKTTKNGKPQPDRWGPAKLWLERHLGDGGTIHAGLRSVGRGLTAGVASAKTGWAEGARGAHTGAPAPIARIGKTIADKVKKPPQPETEQIDPPAEPPNTSPTTDPDQPGGNTKEEPPVAGPNLGGGELTKPGDLGTELKDIDRRVEQIQQELAQIAGYLEGLSDRYAGAGFGTAALTSGVAGMSEQSAPVRAAMQAADAIREHITSLQKGVQEAESLGEQAAEIKAEGPVENFQPA